MSTLHLAKGSEKPKEIEGQARLYSMRYCPYAHRVRLILSLKKIPHDVVNINLKNKPDWYFEIHPEGKVPAFVDTDKKVITESIDICNYLDEKYPEPPLYNENTKDRDMELLDQYSKVTTIFSNCVHGKETRSLDEVVMEIEDYLTEFENELVSRSTTFYGGEQPGMLDILMWPWVERAKALPLMFKQPVKFNKEKLPHIMNWINDMRSQKFVEENADPYEKFAQLIESQRNGNTDFDNF